MTKGIIVTTGTSGGGVGRDIKSRLGQRNLSHSVEILAFDTDGGNVYTRPQPFRDLDPDWRGTEFHRCTPATPDVLEKIQGGILSGANFEMVNPRTLRGLSSNASGAGGTPPNGNFFFRCHTDTIRSKIHRGITNSMQRHEGVVNNLSLPIFLVGTTNGGTASGTLFFLQQLIQEVAEEMKVDINLVTIVGLPGVVNPSKDQENSHAVTAAWLKEYTAIATGYHAHRQKLPGDQRLQTVSTRHVPTIFVSDLNNARPRPCKFTREEQVGLLGELLVSLLTSQLGSRREAQALDFQHRSESERTVKGEPKCLISAGLSMIVLGRSRLGQYGELKLSLAVLSRLQIPLSEEELHSEAETFVQKHQLLEGEEITELSERLCQTLVAGGSTFTIPRLKSLLNSYLQPLKGSALGQQGEAQADMAVFQALDEEDSYETLFSQRQPEVIRLVSEDLTATLNRLIQDRGVVATQQFLVELRELLKHFVTQAVEDNTWFETRCQQAQEEQQQAQTSLMSYVQQLEQQRQHPLYLVYRQKIEQQIATGERTISLRYRQALINYQVLHMQKVAHLAAVEVLDTFLKQVGQLLAPVNEVVETVNQLANKQASDLAALIDHQPTFECPNGLHLHQSEAELKTSYPRLLPAEDEEKAVFTLSQALLNREDLLEFLKDSEQLQIALQQQVQGLIEPRLQGFHVVRELRTRFPDVKDLGQVLQRRDRESMEMAQIKGGCDLDGVFVIRLLSLDNTQAGDLPELLNQHPHDARRSPYEVIDSSDPERIIFYQERHLVPPSELAHFDAYQDAYREVCKKNDFEKLHPLVGSRTFITPGKSIPKQDGQALIVRAWINGQIIQKEDVYYLAVAGLHLPIKQALVDLCSTERGYGCSVDIISQFNCLYLEQGSPALRQALKHLLGVRNNDCPPSHAMEAVIAPFLTNSVYDLLLEQLDWWDTNSVPQAMEWAQPH